MSFLPTLFPRKKNGIVGQVKPKGRRYDLPLNKDSRTDKSNRFLIILMALMSFLLVLTLAAVFVLSGVADRWLGSLEGKATVEIRVQQEDGTITESDSMETLAAQTETYLNAHPAIQTVERLSSGELNEILSPWLGNLDAMQTVSLPILYSLSFRPDVEWRPDQVEADLSAISPQVRLDTHESWLNDIIRMTDMLQTAVIIMMIVILATTVFVIAGSIQSRLSVFQDELELLHLMGASDMYIARQMNRYALLTGLKGASFGFVAAIMFLFAIYFLSRFIDMPFLPSLTLTGAQLASLLIVPLLIGFIAFLTARFTVLQRLRYMP